MRFSSLQEARRFLPRMLVGRTGQRLLTLRQTAAGELMVGGRWEDPDGQPMAIVRDNRLLWAVDPEWTVAVAPGRVALNCRGETTWEVTLRGSEVIVNGAFFTARGLILMEEYGVLRIASENMAARLDARPFDPVHA